MEIQGLELPVLSVIVSPLTLTAESHTIKAAFCDPQRPWTSGVLHKDTLFRGTPLVPDGEQLSPGRRVSLSA